MKFHLSFLLFLFSLSLFGQNPSQKGTSEFIVTPEFMLGISAEANDFFPERDLQKQFILGLGRTHEFNQQEWAYWLHAPKTGVLLGYTDYGNFEELGVSATLMPYLEFGLFGKKVKGISMLVGMGASYFSEKYDEENNFYNQAITTDVTWSFRAGFHYRLFQTSKLDYRLGAVYSHHSNGHTKLPNQGLNSFLGSLSVTVKNPHRVEEDFEEWEAPTKSQYNYLSFRAGWGVNALALAFNDKKEVYTVSGEYGKVWNKTLKLGIGAYYRFYQHYYDYIEGNESLVQEGQEFESYKDNPFWNASNIGVFVNVEFLLNHVGIDLQIGGNIFKPSYKFDWRINEGWDYPPRELPPNWVLGEYTTKFHLKHIISSRMGLKYYLFGTNDVKPHNFYIGAHINANLGQADFTDISFGYVYSFNLRDRN